MSWQGQWQSIYLNRPLDDRARLKLSSNRNVSMAAKHNNPNCDPVRPWFEAVESLGEYIGIRFGHRAPGNEDIEWMYLSHTDYDGIGGLVHLLRERGGKIEELPQITHPGTFSWLAFLRFLPALIAPKRILAWRPLKQGCQPIDMEQAPFAVSTHVFDEEKTLKIRLASRLSNVTVNSLLMKYLDRVVRSSLSDPSCAVPWMVPVNLRGRVVRDHDTGNHSSYVGVRIFASEGAREVQQHIYRAIHKGQHLAAWMGFDVSRNFSTQLRKRIIRANRATSQWSVGCFSNLGEWDSRREITAKPCLGDWFFSPPVLRSQMIGAGCVTFQGRLTLTLQIHPDLTTAPEVAVEWMRSWVREIELGLPDGMGQ